MKDNFNLTLMSKEEKAKEYAKVACLDIVRHYNVFTKEEISKFTTTDYLAGYTQAEQDLSSQLTAYKEALRELVEFKMSSDNLPEKDKYKLSNQSIDVIGCSNNEGSSYHPFFVYYDYDKNKWFSHTSSREVKVISWIHFDLYKIKTLIKD